MLLHKLSVEEDEETLCVYKNEMRTHKKNKGKFSWASSALLSQSESILKCYFGGGTDILIDNQRCFCCEQEHKQTLQCRAVKCYL